MTFQASLAVAFALCAPSICSMSAQAMIFLDSQASTKDLTMLTSLYRTLYWGSWWAPLMPSSANMTAISGPATPEM